MINLGLFCPKPYLYNTPIPQGFLSSNQNHTFTHLPGEPVSCYATRDKGEPLNKGLHK